MFTADYNLVILEFTTRWILSILFFFQAYDRIFRIGLKEVINTFYYQNTEQKLPLWMLKIGTYITAYIEFFSSILLFLGLGRDIVLQVLSINMIIVVFGFSYLNPMWEMKHFFPRFVLIIIQLLLPSSSYVIAIEKYF